MSQQKLTTVGLVLVAAVVGGAAGAGATWAVSETTGGAAKKQNTRAKQVFDESSGELALRLARLENELVALKRRNSSTESLRQYARVLDKGASGSGASNRDETEGEGELGRVVDAEDPTFELAVRTVLDRVDWEREEERQVIQTKRREERAQRQTELLTERLQLNGSQQQDVQRILNEQMDAFRKLRGDSSDGTQRPTTRSEWRARIDHIRAETEQRLATVLDDRQMTDYRQFVDEEGFGARAGRAGARSQRQQPQ